MCPMYHSYSITLFCICLLGFPGGSDGKESASNAGKLGSIPGPGRSPGEGNGNPLQYSCLENPMEKGVHGVAKSQTQQSTQHTYPLYLPANPRPTLHSRLTMVAADS